MALYKSIAVMGSSTVDTPALRMIGPKGRCSLRGHGHGRWSHSLDVGQISVDDPGLLRVISCFHLDWAFFSFHTM